MEKKVKCPYCQEDVEGAIVCRGCGAEPYYVDGTGWTGFAVVCLVVVGGIAIDIWWGYFIAFLGLGGLKTVSKQKRWRWSR